MGALTAWLHGFRAARQLERQRQQAEARVAEAEAGTEAESLVAAEERARHAAKVAELQTLAERAEARHAASRGAQRRLALARLGARRLGGVLRWALAAWAGRRAAAAVVERRGGRVRAVLGRRALARAWRRWCHVAVRSRSGMLVASPTARTARTAPDAYSAAFVGELQVPGRAHASAAPAACAAALARR